MMHFVKICDGDDGEAIEIPTEDNGNLSLASISAQYPGTTGLKYYVEGRARAIRISNGELYPPEGGWSDNTYYCTFPKGTVKRKADDVVETSDSKTPKSDSNSSWVSTDLVVLGLPWKTTDKELRDYFSQFGELQFVQVKTDPLTKKSKGYGFIRFADQEVQVRVMLQRHQIDGRWCDVRVPVSKESSKKKLPCKVFIGQITEDLTEDVLRDYFQKFGEISDLFVPKPFRSFGFVTFTEANAAKTVCSQEHKIKDTKIRVTEAIPKNETDKFDRGRPPRSVFNNRREAFGNSNYNDYFDKRPWFGKDDRSWGHANGGGW